MSEESEGTPTPAASSPSPALPGSDSGVLSHKTIFIIITSFFGQPPRASSTGSSVSSSSTSSCQVAKFLSPSSLHRPVLTNCQSQIAASKAGTKHKTQATLAHVQRARRPDRKYTVERNTSITNKDHSREVGTKRSHEVILVVNIAEATVAQARPSQDVRHIIRRRPCSTPASAPVSGHDLLFPLSRIAAARPANCCKAGVSGRARAGSPNGSNLRIRIRIRVRSGGGNPRRPLAEAIISWGPPGTRQLEHRRMPQLTTIFARQRLSPCGSRWECCAVVERRLHRKDNVASTSHGSPHWNDNDVSLSLELPD